MTAARPVVRDRLVVLAVYVLAGVAAGAIVLFSGAALGPLWTAALADLGATALVFGFSWRLDNSSVYDPYWSVAPVFIAAYWWMAGGADAGVTRALLVVVLVVIWSIRLTANWVRRWHGLGDEDWRYVMLRDRHGSRYWLVSFLGIHMMPTVLVFLGCLPLYAVLAESPAGWTALDFFAGALTALAIWMEATADAQLRRFRSVGAAPSELLDTGLWALCRHPNYLGEILFWWGLFAFGLAADVRYWWTGVGALSITLLFVFISVPMIDARMLERRPGYAERMQSVSALLPRRRA